MSKYSLIAFLLLSPLAAASNAFADTRLGDSCDLSIFGVKDKDGFLRFDQALRSAMEKQDAAALTPLILFPLRVNYAGGKHVFLNNDAGFRKQFSSVFSSAIRKAVAQQKTDTLFCRDQGVMYGDGEIWIGVEGTKADRFGIQTVNMPGPSVIIGGLLQPLKKTLSCTAQKVHISIDYPEQTAQVQFVAPARYRAWSSPHVQSDRPDLELTGTVGIGKGQVEGICDFRMWVFENGNTRYLLSEPACRSKSPPSGALAELEVQIGSKRQPTSWCY